MSPRKEQNTMKKLSQLIMFFSLLMEITAAEIERFSAMFQEKKQEVGTEVSIGFWRNGFATN